MSDSTLARFRPITYNALRVMAAFLFMPHGAQKLFGWFRDEPRTVELFSIMGLAGVIEFFGGLLILLGLFTRPAAFIAAGEMAVAYFWRHFPNSFWPIENRGERAALYCFVFLLIWAFGPGRYSVDAWLKRRRARSTPGPDASGGEGSAALDPTWGT